MVVCMCSGGEGGATDVRGEGRTLYNGDTTHGRQDNKVVTLMALRETLVINRIG